MFRPLSAIALALLMATAVLAADAAPKGADGNKVQAVKAFRSSTLTGMEVRNLHDEKLGKIEDMVIDVEHGRVAYAALGVGGFLGLGEKLFAIPWNEFTIKHTEKETFVVLDMDKEKLKAAPGFDKDHWPNVADPNWSQEVDRYYRQRVAERAAAIKLKRRRYRSRLVP